MDDPLSSSSPAKPAATSAPTQTPSGSYGSVVIRPANSDEKLLGVVMHALCLIGLPIIGPLIVWLMKKDQSTYLDAQGRELMNFQISLLLYFFISFLLVFVIVGVPLLFVLGFGSLILTIIGLVKAADGQLYRFPLTIRLL
jgi:hypothetical protein